MTEISASLWSQSAIGKELSEAEAYELFAVSKREHYAKDEVLFDEGSPAVAFFLIVDGDIDIEKRGDQGRVSTIATLTPGAVVGEMSLLVNEDRSAAARVKTDDATVLRVEWTDFEQLLSENRAAAYKLILALARLLAYRLKRVNLKVAELSTKDEISAPKLEEFASFKSKLMNEWSF